MTNDQFLIGLDLGTSAVKVGLFDAEGNALRRARRTYPLHAPRPGWAEQEPEEWWAAVCDALREVLAGVEADRVVAVGLSGQAPSQVLVASDGAPLGRAIVWSDRRAAAEADWLAERVTPEQARDWTGYAFITGASQPPARLLWLKAHRPDDWACCAAIVQPKDFIACQLTGQIATDINSSFCLYNPQTSQYATDLLALLDVEPEKMPPVLEPTAVVGRVTPEAASATGLRAGVPVVTGTIDAWCDIIGCGAVAPGCAVDVTGTSEVVALVTEQPVDGEGVASAPLAEGRYWIGGPMQAGGAALLWLARCFYGQEQPDFELMEAEASGVATGAEGLLFLPYLQGERAPVWDPVARGAFVGLTDRHTRAHCARAVYEGVAFAVRDLLERCRTAAGIGPEELRVSGGGSVSNFWNQVKADVTGLPVQRVATPDAACLGAAMLAAVGVGWFRDLEDAVGAMVQIGDVFDPIPDCVSHYDRLFAAWRRLYPALCPIFPQLEIE
ncbi:MAG: FGGY family carbohydrate kinase [Chloroflexota bacterium]|nr:FGGY family carbohydrate kinase [Chloroflexota bacterium]